jgi:hypothetical protein
MKLRKTIESLLNQYPSVQVACTCSNACRWQYLTTSGQVCREEFGFIEDNLGCDDEHTRIDLPKMTWASICRLQRALINLSNN